MHDCPDYPRCETRKPAEAQVGDGICSADDREITLIPLPERFRLCTPRHTAPNDIRVAGCSVERDRRASDIISLPLLLAMLSPCRSPSGRSRSLALPLDGRVERHKLPTSPTLDENGSS